MVVEDGLNLEICYKKPCIYRKESFDVEKTENKANPTFLNPSKSQEWWNGRLSRWWVTN